MKKIMAVMVCIVALCWAGSSFATPFQINGTTVDLSAFGGGLYTFTSNSSGVEELAVGESFDFNFGTFEYPLSLATGQIDFTVDFATPIVSGAADTGDFSVASFFFVSYRALSFGDPVIVDYSYNGFTGGQLELDFYDISRGVQFGTSDSIYGKITNIADATTAPVPEPSTILLFGAGIAGLVGYSRRRSNKKA